MHLAVFGASFDPPHNGHLALSLFARELLGLDSLIISVSNNPFKQNRGTTDEHRMCMAMLLSREINRTGPCCEVSGWELEKKQPSYTVDLLRHLHILYPTDKLTLLVGEDSFRDFSSWKEPDILFSLCDIVVFSRASAQQGVPMHKTMREKGEVKMIEFASPVSSTIIRDFVAAGVPFSHLVPPSVHRYIIEYGLYRNLRVPATSTQALKRQGF